MRVENKVLLFLVPAMFALGGPFACGSDDDGGDGGAGGAGASGSNSSSTGIPSVASSTGTGIPQSSSSGDPGMCTGLGETFGGADALRGCAGCLEANCCVELSDADAEREMVRLQAIVVALRTMRAENEVHPRVTLDVELRTTDAAAADKLSRDLAAIGALCNARVALAMVAGDPPEDRAVAVAEGVTVLVPTAQLVDPASTNSLLRVTVTGNNIAVSLATNDGGAITSTAAQVIAAINASPAASALVTASKYRTSAAGGVVIAGIIVYAPRKRRTLWQVLGLTAYSALLVVAIVLRTLQLA